MGNILHFVVLAILIRFLISKTLLLQTQGKFAKLKPSLEKYLHYLTSGALLDHNDTGTIQRFVQQLKLLPRGNTSHFLCPKVYVSPYLNGPKANK